MTLSERVLTRENGVIAACVVVATALYFALGSYTDLPQWAAYFAAIGVGVFLPGYLTGRYRSA